MHPYRRVDISMMFSRVRYVRSAAVGVVPARGRSCRPSRWRMRLNCDWELVLMNNTRQLGIKLSKTTQRSSWPRCTENSTFDADYMVLSSCTRPFHRGHSTMSSLNRPQRGHALLMRPGPRARRAFVSWLPETTNCLGSGDIDYGGISLSTRTGSGGRT